VLSYAIVDASVEYTGTERINVGGVWIGAQPALAICESLRDREIMLLRCNEDWEVVSCASCESIEEARDDAERYYRGVSRLWTDRGVSREEAEAFDRERWGELVCSFCDRTPDHFDKIVTAADGGASICNECVARVRELMG